MQLRLVLKFLLLAGIGFYMALQQVRYCVVTLQKQGWHQMYESS